ncbi:hypothetical protein PV783_13690 [Chitinophaga sp. CC14]|uniref:hypothetical protein n=1 Tax=Chitinophaga sp. CC14 TaxID=3029199 RepID=UPI003B77DD78
MKHLLLFISVTGLCLSLSAQVWYKDGRIVDQRNEVKYGKVGARDWGHTPQQFFFRQVGLSGKTDTLDIHSSSQVFAEGVTYRRLVSGKDTLYTEIVVDNKLSLFSYKDKIEEHFYLQGSQDSDCAEELISRRVKLSCWDEQSDFEYKCQLYRWFLKRFDELSLDRCLFFIDNITKARYSRKSLINLVNTLNNLDVSDTTYQKLTRAKYFKRSFFAGAGSTLSIIKMEGNGDEMGQLNFKKPASPFMQAGISWIDPWYVQNLIGRFSVSCYSFSQKANGTPQIRRYNDSTRLSFKQTLITFNLGGLYKLLKISPSMSFWMGMDISWEICLTSKSVLDEYKNLTVEQKKDYIIVANTLVSGGLRSSLFLDYGKVEVSGYYKYMFDYVNQTHYTLRQRCLGLGILYHFNRIF